MVARSALDTPHDLVPLRCLKIIAFIRYTLPEKKILIYGGRDQNLGELHAMVFYAGARVIMTGNYLTREGRTLDKDLEIINAPGLKPRKKLG
jgi:biotin synthase